MSWLLYQLVYNPACLVVPGGAWMGSCIAVRGALPRPLLVAESRASPTKLLLPHRSLNFSRGVISEPDLLTTPDAEILDGFSGQGVIQVRRITIKKDATVIPTKHMILTFNNPNLPTTVKKLSQCKIRPYVPNPLRCFKCQRFGHSQIACRGQLTCALDVHLLDMRPQIAL
ncbi:RNA-directed DNA polymerase from mobile element jockey [Trichonephila clavipes]|nr:RNA-directed DNA polymerase from mobile element jockey [Trichonephila clavipes]